ncbi:Gfo/Idh/MocA family oxidoreductase, partial [Pseudovibrio sp. W74]|uniref:Gfo/Idh/MocA family protein n=2 Tax=unclassified Pseudovibrio TaxID=2627060 RepID=UPI001FCC6C53
MGNQPVRVAILGTGRISDLHAIEYKQNPKGKIVALCDQNVKQAQSQAEAWGVDDPIISDDYREILARPDVDLVEILLPHHLHLQAALDAIAAGKMVSLQKPMCMNMEEADILVEAAESYDRPFKIFENFIFHPPVLKAKELVDAGAIGDPISIRIKSNPGKSK